MAPLVAYSTNRREALANVNRSGAIPTANLHQNQHWGRVLSGGCNGYGVALSANIADRNKKLKVPEGITFKQLLGQLYRQSI